MRAIRATHAFDGHRFLPDGATVLLAHGRIAGVGPRDALLPVGLPVSAYDGTLLPGLIDCHVHLVADSGPAGLEPIGDCDTERLAAVITASLAAQARAGVTTVRDLGDRGYLTLDVRDRPGLPRVLAAGPPITTVGGHCHVLGGAVDGRGPEAAVAEHVDHGVDLIKVMASGGMLTPGTDVFGTQFGPDQLRSLTECAHEAGRRVVAHVHSLRAAEASVAAGVDGLEHFGCLTEDGPSVPDDLLDAIAGAGITVDLTPGWDPAQLPDPARAPPGVRATMARLGLSWDGIQQHQRETALRLRAHGIRMVLGLDAGISPAKAHGNLWRAVATLVEGGYPVDEALAAVTAVAAEDCGLAGTTGALRTGLAVDLLVVDGDVERDIAALGRPLLVLVRGVEPAA